SLAEFNMLNYTEKLWGLPCSKLSADWAEQRIKGLSVSALLKNMFLKKKGPKTLVDQFYYPELGTGLIYETIKNKIEKKNRVILDNEPVKIIHKNNVIKKVKMKKGKSFSPQNLISSIPINRFVEILDPKPPANVLKALKKLKFRSQVYLFLTVNKPFIAKDQWIYFPETHIPLGRMSEMKNFSQKMSPRDKTSLFIEFFCWEGDETWKMKKEELIKISLDWLERLGFVKKEEVIDSYHLKQKNVYPVYDVGYKENLAVVKNYLDTFKNLIYIGRPGRFKYTNQDHSLEMGILAAKSIIENKKLNVEDVGTEKEYFEKGIIR
ncbi:MAG: FAD-dependent oxidoreductase, partial [Nanoarchaeota archaeon]|nr:FAD-dependent oxidoreductase [Nanoarchaeota archaeon]